MPHLVIHSYRVQNTIIIHNFYYLKYIELYNSTAINVVGRGGEVKEEVDDNIDLSPEQNDEQNHETAQNRYQVADSDDEFKDAQ